MDLELGLEKLNLDLVDIEFGGINLVNFREKIKSHFYLGDLFCIRETPPQSRGVGIY